ncbi:MAG: phosphoglycerate mutase family protein [Acidimicrobiales bacterium]|nr:phosphoglycerate mutase family protein [Acidimicrobiales bacterium]
MDAAVVVLLGLMVLALAVAAGGDVVRGVRTRGTPAPSLVAPPPSRPRRLVLVRHGETEWSLTGQHTGRTDVPLLDEGREQGRAVRALLEGWHFDAILVSPLGRARETLELLGRDEPVTVVEDLREWDYGDDEGRTTKEIRADRPGWTVFADGPQGGETIEQVAARARRVLRVAAEHEGDVLVVGHGHMLRVLATCWTGLDPRAGAVLHLDAATVSVLDHIREQAVIRRWNVSG